MATTPRSTQTDDTPAQQAKEAVRDAADTVRGVANEAAARFPDALVRPHPHRLDVLEQGPLQRPVGRFLDVRRAG